MRTFVQHPAFQNAFHGGAAILVLVAAVAGVERAWDIVEPLIVAAVLATAVATFGVAMYFVDSTTLSSKIYGDMLHLPMVVVLIALLIGASLMGVWGAMIAAPVAAGIQTIVEDQLASG